MPQMTLEERIEYRRLQITRLSALLAADLAELGPYGEDTCPGDRTHRLSSHDPGGAWFGFPVSHIPVEGVR